MNLARFLLVWSGVKRLLHLISLVPMVRAFDRLPDRAASAFGGYLYSRRLRFALLLLPRHQLRLLEPMTRQLKDASWEAGQTDLPLDEAELGGIARQASDFAQTLAAEMDSPARPAGLPPKLRQKFKELTHSLFHKLARFWPERSVDQVFGQAGAVEPEPFQTPSGRWVQVAEDFVAVAVVFYVSQYFVQLRNLVWSMVVSASLLVLAATSYPFHPEGFLLFFLLALLGAIVVSIVYVLVQINRDELISRISKTTPNRFTPDADFLGSVGTYVLPVVAILVIQLTGTFRFLVEPLVRMLR